MLHQPTTKTNATTFHYLISQPIRPEIVDHIVVAASRVVWCNPAMKNPDGISINHLPTLATFITWLIRASGISTGTLVATVIYLARLKKRLSPATTGSQCSAHRIFLSVLILTSKYLHDTNYSNKNWAQYCNYKDNKRPGPFPPFVSSMLWFPFPAEALKLESVFVSSRSLQSTQREK
ncbi:hypothetical protein V8F33_010470 [Rhypophila sp. PSN 637]